MTTALELKKENDLKIVENQPTFSQDERDKAAVSIGYITAFQKISNVLSAEFMRALIQFQEMKMHEALGYSRFENFLNESPYSPMSKNQFYDRAKILETEGDELFDLLNNFGLAVSKRKLLGKGNIQLDGNKIIVIDPATNEEISFDAGDKSRILETITALADANADKTKKLDKGREDNERLKRKLNETEEALETARLSPNAANQDEIENCYMVVGSTMQRLNSLLEEATIVRVSQFENKSLRVLAAQYQQLNEIIADKLPGAHTGAALSDSEEDRLASLLDDED